MKKILIMVLTVALGVAFAASTGAQQKSQQKKPPVVTPAGEIQLDALHVEAIIEKPSVSIVSKRIEPELEEVEFILRDFDRELRVLPRGLFSFDADKYRVEKIKNVDELIHRKR